MRHEVRGRQRQCYPLHRRDDAAHVLPRHGRHAVLQMALEGKLKCNRHHSLRATPGVTGYPASGCSNLEGGREVQRAVRARRVLQNIHTGGED